MKEKKNWPLNKWKLASSSMKSTKVSKMATEVAVKEPSNTFKLNEAVRSEIRGTVV
jgi:hypothetical protein